VAVSSAIIAATAYLVNLLLIHLLVPRLEPVQFAERMEAAG